MNIFKPLNSLGLVLFIAGTLYACTQASQGIATQPPPDKVYTSLLDRLREEPGLTISGTGNNATIRIRGNSSLVGDNEPLFVVNGTPVGRGYASVSSTIDVNNVKAIRVLTRSQSGLYGARGGNGVVVITLK